MAEVKRLKALVQVEGMNGLHRADVIQYEGKHWIVPYWLDSPVEKVTRPLRIIQIESIQHQKIDDKPEFQFVINQPIPKDVFEHGQVQQGSKYVVVESPDIAFPIPVVKKPH
jgi:hypothetical protein